MPTTALLMDDSELTGLFRGARDKRKQIGVLADLNCCAPIIVAQRLEDLGLLEGTDLKAEEFDKPQRRSYAPRIEPLDEIRAMELFREGLDDIGIAEALGCAVYRIKDWRSRMHLLRPRGGNQSLKKKKEGEMAIKQKGEVAVPDQAEDAPPAQEGEVALLTVAEFLATLTELLTPAATRAGLLINGSPVTAITGLHISAGRGCPTVEITTEGYDDDR